MHRYFALFFCLLLCPLVEGRACENGTTPLQSKALSKYKGASKHLTEAMSCLRGKQYPDDINECGISSFGNELEQTQVEVCLRSQTPKSVRALGASKQRNQDQKIALMIDCDNQRVLVVFRKEKNQFVVDGINFLVDYLPMVQLRAA